MTTPAHHIFSDLRIGQQAAFQTSVSADDLDRFIELSGDRNPLHADRSFARARGFADRVVHGAYLSALVSRLVGVHLPGQNCILHSINLQFKSPLLVESEVLVQAVVEQLSEAVQAAILKVSITDLRDGRVVSTGKVHLGFTAEVP
jgi:3-hydroxybutyryl-CoA dehydratase